MPETGSESAGKTGRKICRVKITADDIAECLTEYPGMCRHALSFGSGFFCRHPGREEFTIVHDSRMPGS